MRYVTDIPLGFTVVNVFITDQVSNANSLATNIGLIQEQQGLFQCELGKNDILR